jgi:hypothetical protein
LALFFQFGTDLPHRKAFESSAPKRRIGFVFSDRPYAPPTRPVSSSLLRFRSAKIAISSPQLALFFQIGTDLPHRKAFESSAPRRRIGFVFSDQPYAPQTRPVSSPLLRFRSAKIAISSPQLAWFFQPAPSSSPVA